MYLFRISSRLGYGLSLVALMLAMVAAPRLLTAAAPETQPAATAAPAKISFLIVAPEQFQDALKDFVAYKAKLMKVELVTLEKVLKTNEGVDDPEKLKHYLYAAWKERRVSHVLLVGDADVFPVRYMVLDRITPPAFDYSFYPSDLYYADVAKPDGSFEDWNAQKDGFHAGYFGEVRGEKNKNDPINYDNIDYRPELAVGRWPVSTPEEVRIVAEKTIRYERSLASAAGSAPRAAFVCVGGWVDARGHLDRIASLLPTGWSAAKLYYTDKGQPTDTPPPDAKHVVDLLNEGVRLMLHVGHGLNDRWEQSLNIRSLSKLNNADHPAILMSAGCYTARFASLGPYEPYIDVDGNAHKGTDHGEVFTAPPPPPAPYQKGDLYNPVGLGEQLLRGGPNGAVAYFGCNTGGQPCGVTLLEGFVDAIGKQPDARLGDCWAKAIGYYWEHQHLAELKPNADWYPPAIFFQGMKFMLFGDPTIPVAGAEPARTK